MRLVQPCAYCGQRGTQVDHLIKRNQARRRPTAKIARDDPKYQVPCCYECNMAIGTRYRVPESHAHLIPELEKLTGNVYSTYSGDVSDLRRIVI